jgi:hypothetical protein
VRLVTVRQQERHSSLNIVENQIGMRGGSHQSLSPLIKFVSKVSEMVSKAERRVRFQLHSLSECIEQNCEALAVEDFWYSSKEYDCFAYENDMITRSIRKRYELDCSNTFSYCGTLLNAYDFCLKKEFPNDESLLALARWLTSGISRRGLEKKCLRTLYKGRREAIKKSISAVLSAQASLHDSMVDKEEQIRLIYQEIATPSKLFALALAHASWLGVNKESTIAIKVVAYSNSHLKSTPYTSEWAKRISVRS